ncbi:unnamed protein product [Meloidogyne enterolobii]|uniref:Uncharacterized protein n=1 Tax=Meloidogyne enterolobii TaxID=390850 RepID=A0ACB0ZAM5_MELEN
MTPTSTLAVSISHGPNSVFFSIRFSTFFSSSSLSTGLLLCTNASYLSFRDLIHMSVFLSHSLFRLHSILHYYIFYTCQMHSFPLSIFWVFKD